jgi:hypothetical protein
MMVLFETGLFWFLLGILACLAVLGCKVWLEDKQIRTPWWKWILVVLWAVFVGASVAYVGTSLGENESRAALMGALFSGVIAIISAVALWRILRWR